MSTKQPTFCSIVAATLPSSFKSYFETYMTKTSHHCDRCKSGKCFTGRYSDIRAGLDYNYHRNYPLERQLFQDQIIEKFLCEGTSSNRPTIIFTAGAMGAGKSYSIRKLQSEMQLNLDSFLVIDPDRIKEELPEYQKLKIENPELAGSQVHVESGFIQEILLYTALSMDKNIIIDGSLRDVDWNAKLIKKLRQNYPHYQPFQIIYVFADAERVLERAAQRGKQTGRIVPEDVLLGTLKVVPHSVDVLKELVDKTWYINNDAVPTLDHTYVPLLAPQKTELPISIKEKACQLAANIVHARAKCSKTL